MVKSDFSWRIARVSMHLQDYSFQSLRLNSTSLRFLQQTLQVEEHPRSMFGGYGLF